MSEAHIRARLTYCKNHKHYCYDDWDKVIFSDESKFNRNGSDGRQYIYRNAAERLNPKNINGVRKFGGGSVMVWGCITSLGVGKIHRCTKKMNSSEHCQIMETGLLGTLKKYGLSPRDVEYMHDNAPIHKSKETKSWINIYNINTMEWPAFSPDLYPIENV